MLDPWIIEQIRKREEEQRRPHERPAIEMPDYPNHRRVPDGYDDEERSPPPSERGVVIIDFGV